VFQRPSDAEIEDMFQAVIQSRGLNIPNLSIDQKWQLVYNDEQLKLKEAKEKEQQARKQMETGQRQVVEETPEWYVQRILSETITVKQASSLGVSLRSNPKRCEWPFISSVHVPDTTLAGSRSLMHSKEFQYLSKPSYI
jgi:cytokinesis protein